MANRFYINCPLAPGPLHLEGPEAHHLANVCRLRPGDAVCLFNGDGHEYPARVQSVSRSVVELDVLQLATVRRELGFCLEIAAPLPKGDRAQFLIEKLTELGVSVLVPLHTQRSVVHPRAGKLEKLGRYVVEASKQCGRNVLMRVESMVSWENYCQREQLPAARFVAHPRIQEGGERTNAKEATDAAGSVRAGCHVPLAPTDMAMAVGPEGGFADEEIEQAREFGWRVLDLGPRILRIETAALLVAAWATKLSLNCIENTSS